MGVKIASVNIEGQKHLETVKEFLAREDADIVCLMEVAREDVLTLAGSDYPFVVFAPNDVLGNIAKMTSLEPCGVAILSKNVMIDVEKEYFGERPNTQIIMTRIGKHAPVLLMAKIGEYLIGAIHFTWSKKGEVSELQRQHIEKLLEYLHGKEELVLCGDFNIPRGNELYLKLLTNYRDNIPMEVETTIDPILHYANKVETGELKTVVDYVWSTPSYKVSEVHVVSGVSDHCGVVCEIDKVIK